MKWELLSCLNSRDGRLFGSLSVTSFRCALWIDESPRRAIFFSTGLKYKLPILFHQVVVLQLRIYLFKEKTLFALANAFHVHKQHGRKLASD